AVKLLDRLEDSGQRRLVREAITVITAPQGRLEPARRELDASAIGQHFGSRTRVVHVVPFDRVLASGATPRFAAVSAASRPPRARPRPPPPPGGSDPPGWLRPAVRSASAAESLDGGRIAIAQELRATFSFVGLADRGGGPTEQEEAFQEAAVGVVGPRHRAG